MRETRTAMASRSSLSFRRSCRGQGTATQRSYCTSSTIDLPPRGRQRARVSVCFARAEYIDVMLMPASERDVWSRSTNHSTRVHGDYFAVLALDNYSVLLLLLLLGQQLSTLHDD